MNAVEGVGRGDDAETCVAVAEVVAAAAAASPFRPTVAKPPIA
jgi:hypothetical protein